MTALVLCLPHVSMIIGNVKTLNACGHLREPPWLARRIAKLPGLGYLQLLLRLPLLSGFSSSGASPIVALAPARLGILPGWMNGFGELRVLGDVEFDWMVDDQLPEWLRM